MTLSFRLQALGWAMVAVIDFTLNRAANPSDEIGWSIYSAVALGGLGWLVTTIMLALYRRFLPAARAKFDVFVGLGVLVSSAAWYLLSSTLDMLVGFPYATSFVEGLFGKGTLCLFISVAWRLVGRTRIGSSGTCRTASSRGPAPSASLPTKSALLV